MPKTENMLTDPSGSSIVALAHELNGMKLIDGLDKKHNEGLYSDLTDGRYKKTIYVKTWTGRTVSLETDLEHAVEAKTGISKNQQHLASRGKVLTDKRTLKAD